MTRTDSGEPLLKPASDQTGLIAQIVTLASQLTEESKKVVIKLMEQEEVTRQRKELWEQAVREGGE